MSVDSLLSPPPKIELINAFDAPYNNAIATARTCYSSRVITPQETAAKPALRDRIAASTYRAGHHTTIQHATFQFSMEGVSRQCIWSFLHSHPFYNSEQVSQRYVPVRADRVTTPALRDVRSRERYAAMVRRQHDAYKALIELLTPAAAAAYYARFPARKKAADRGDTQGPRDVKKRAQEVARYVLPVATQAHLYHTISGLTLHRLHRICESWDTPQETRLVVKAMVDRVNAHDPLFFARIEDTIPLEETHEARVFNALSLSVGEHAAEFVKEFDESLEGRTSRLIAYTQGAPSVIAGAVRAVLGVPRRLLDDDAALAQVLDPAKNNYLGQALNLTHHGKLTRCLTHASYTFRRKLSHTADSQDQRHRLVLGSRPILAAHLDPTQPDYITPRLFQEVPEARALYDELMRETWAAIGDLIEWGEAKTDALYLLPNAAAVRFEASGDLLGLWHKWTLRLCYNAQEEIWQASAEEAAQVRAVHPEIGRYLGAPCHHRAAAKRRPYCPEGDRFCGVPVWRLALDEMERVI